MTIQTVTDAIRYVGVDDNTLALFENQYPVQPISTSGTLELRALYMAVMTLSDISESLARSASMRACRMTCCCSFSTQ